MKFGIFQKHLLSFTLLIILTLSVSLIIALKSIKQSYIEHTKEHLLHLARLVELIIEHDSLQAGNEQLKKKIQILSKNIDSRVTIILETGEVIIDSETNPDLLVNHNNRPEILEARNNGIGFRLRLSDTLHEKMIYVAIPIYQDGKIKAFIRVSSFVNEVFVLLDTIKKNIFITAFIVIIFSFIISLLLANHFTKPIRKLAEASQKVANGNYKVRVFSENKDETHELTNNFNFMVEKINQQVSELSMKSEELTSIINSIHEIFWIINSEERIVFQNQAFIDFVNISNIDHGFYWDVLENPELIEKIENLIKSKVSAKVEIKIRARFYLISSSYLQKSSSTIFLLYDITEIKNLQKMKKDFVINASHELRTPLTSIKGFLETMETDLGSDYSHYFNILKRNTDRLIYIVNDILTLSEIETTHQLSLEKMDIRKILQNSINIFQQNAIEKKIKITTNFAKIPKIKVDPFRLEQVFVNLIDNSIKYSNENNSVSIIVKTQDNFVVIDFVDNGIGIQEEKIPRLFERFYVVDKSRTRKVGGTGLGLSIVKHIIQLHKGRIDIQSEFGKRTSVKIWLPIAT
ncbi:MAG: HAMP domain-containing protein [Candidatus Cloacimonetes bacterium]|nr:HAMP domain-containing protein [Candidatus Cloacimonadota bacterium]